MTLEQEYRERYQEGWEDGRIKGKIELLYLDFGLPISEIAVRLSIPEEQVQKVVDTLKKSK